MNLAIPRGMVQTLAWGMIAMPFALPNIAWELGWVRPPETTPDRQGRTIEDPASTGEEVDSTGRTLEVVDVTSTGALTTEAPSASVPILEPAPIVPCPPGTRRTGAKCRPICGKGTELKGNRCEPIVCASGQRLEHGRCVDAACGAGRALAYDGRCIPKLKVDPVKRSPYVHPIATCGNLVCEPARGESSQTCCEDCPCDAPFVCKRDVTGGRACLVKGLK
ncbi:hypothetical protein [Nannocystis radixulma]|uniref:TIL domain-containing protein n=1 Tax=Nannocystis radixulma TaxID=2995305 RepID=A0ABT5BKK1_9BACT|nr:hypothetical protein [Nannocystis radixulma]MDC0674670.1 hypothetical protein [Nannocystis radixulma]